MRVQPINARMPVHQASPLQPTPQSQRVAPTSSLNPITQPETLGLQKLGKTDVPFGLTTISFGQLNQAPKVASAFTRPNPSLGHRLDYYA
ncbi:hypothetical protein [Vampirovibrio sp.]|uniref:hypothetical protein n=1 Tax=Vampirovibrio sp. TaxID=2717857 RepID=UPI0035942944